jgi:nitroimidazol reductase NimA-like FMN-containing flavoprotein (pyridoxamine 5'-phosphate oxidase superfamily)
MFIHEMSRAECNDALTRGKVGRLACSYDNQPYVLPLNFAFDGGSYVYFFTTLGRKVEWMRSNPLVCLEIDEVKNHNHWSSVVVLGTYEELPDKAEYETARRQARASSAARDVVGAGVHLTRSQRKASFSDTYSLSHKNR